MRKKILFFVCSVILCTSLIGCNVQKEAENNNIESVTETYNTISPLPGSIDINNLDNCTLPVSLEKGDAYVDDTGAMQMDVTVYTYDLYDMVDINSLKEGDTIIIRNQEIEVNSLERLEKEILINGGFDNDGYEFRTDDTTVWYEYGYSDSKFYYELGDATIRVSAEMNFYDSSDLDKGEVTYYPGDFLTDKAGITYHFVPENTEIVIVDGKIVEMYRTYIP